MEHPLAYRNKAQVPVRRVNGQLETGLFPEKIPMISCRLRTLYSGPVIDQVILFTVTCYAALTSSLHDEKGRALA